tara:strand:+ start:71 stop:274 length:204 start_codon:yes stop_codon:yes gene_type:complete
MRIYKLYNSISWNFKEAVGFAHNFDNLTTDQQNFIEEIYSMSSPAHHVKDDLTSIKSDLEEVIDNLN